LAVDGVLFDTETQYEKAALAAAREIRSDHYGLDLAPCTRSGA
jgi:hypothetical protein